MPKEQPPGTRLLFQNAVAANANGTSFQVPQYAYILIQVSGITTATINWEVSLDNSNWSSCAGYPLSGVYVAATSVSTTTANGIFRIETQGATYIRARISGYSAGTITVIGRGVSFPHSLP